ncbi:hypothetical protein F4819DRAFT_488611 [Hypoxylon fuscum]|nr:hypothetical protein F4819DRAFT_488611 [Hypoxylon fuscum]
MSEIQCSQGHNHWGLFGGAGILPWRYRDSGEVELLLGLRHATTEDGRTWSTVGGAIEKDEPFQVAAAREMREEIGLDATDLVPTALSVVDHGNWRYYTILAQPSRYIDISELTLQTSEITEVAWITRGELGNGKYTKLNPHFDTGTRQDLNFLLPPDINPLDGSFRV